MPLSRVFREMITPAGIREFLWDLANMRWCERNKDNCGLSHSASDALCNQQSMKGTIPPTLRQIMREASSRFAIEVHAFYMMRTCITELISGKHPTR